MSIAYPLSLPLPSSDPQAQSSEPLATLTHPSPELWELEMHNGADNRLSAFFIVHCLQKAFDIVESEWRALGAGAPGALVIVGKKDQSKFFSNGLDYEKASKDTNFTPYTWNPLMARIMSYPIPIVAALNGHTFAGGYLMALACDYRVMTAGKAWCCMNEIHFGAPFAPSMTSILNYKLPTRAIRKTAIEGHRFTPSELFELGVVDLTVPVSPSQSSSSRPDSAALVKAAHEFALSKAPLAKSGVFGLIKKELAREVFEACMLDGRLVHPVDQRRLYSQQGVSLIRL